VNTAVLKTFAVCGSPADGVRLACDLEKATEGVSTMVRDLLNVALRQMVTRVFLVRARAWLKNAPPEGPALLDAGSICRAYLGDELSSTAKVLISEICVADAVQRELAAQGEKDKEGELHHGLN
jgi:hypothetical protein